MIPGHGGTSLQSQPLGGQGLVTDRPLQCLSPALPFPKTFLSAHTCMILSRTLRRHGILEPCSPWKHSLHLDLEMFMSAMGHRLSVFRPLLAPLPGSSSFTVARLTPAHKCFATSLFFAQPWRALWVPFPSSHREVRFISPPD